MIYRFLFVAYSDNMNSIRIQPNNGCYTALSQEGNQVYLYVESTMENVDPQKLVVGDLLSYPDGEKWKRANEIFHYSKPLDQKQWRRKQEKTPFIMINRLKPEKISSYVYYHYQYQEEMPGDGDRYGIMFLFYDQLIFYLEKPTERETEKIEGLLRTANTPIENWQELMREHFAEQWKPVANLQVSDYIEFGCANCKGKD